MSIADFIIAHVTRRPPDFLVGGPTDPYMRRWWVISRNRFFNIYLHQFMRDDEDRALHDHPWQSLSWLMRGELFENWASSFRVIREGQWVWRSATMAHRLSMLDIYRGRTWTLFITGPVIRGWGFHCPKGWVPWREFVDATDTGNIGRGCGEQ
jgi:hypothetical protein